MTDCRYTSLCVAFDSIIAVDGFPDEDARIDDEVAHGTESRLTVAWDAAPFVIRFGRRQP